MGANYQPWTSIPVRAYVEVGGSYDLIDRNRKRFRESVVGGVTGYQEWYSQTNCDHSLCLDNYFTDLYGNVATYSREDYNVIGDLRLRTGLNLYKGESGTVQAYVKLHGLADSEDEYYNNLFEYGPHFMAAFNYQPIKLRVERLYGNYFKDVPVNTKDHYNNTRVELVFIRISNNEENFYFNCIWYSSRAHKVGSGNFISKTRCTISGRSYFTGQHDELVRDAIDFFEVEIDHRLKIMKAGQSLNQLLIHGLTQLENIYTDGQKEMQLLFKVILQPC